MSGHSKEYYNSFYRKSFFYANCICDQLKAEDKYMLIVTIEADKPLSFYAERPEEGHFVALECFSTAKELEQIISYHEGYFYQLYRVRDPKRLSYGMIDSMYPMADFEELERERK